MVSDPDKFGRLADVPYELAFQQLLAECASAMKLMGRNNIVTFAHDDGSDFNYLHAIYKAFKKRNPHLANVMMDFVAVKDEHHPPAQAADVAALEPIVLRKNGQQSRQKKNMMRLRTTMYKVNVWGEQQKTSLPMNGNLPNVNM